MSDREKIEFLSTNGKFWDCPNCGLRMTDAEYKQTLAEHCCRCRTHLGWFSSVEAAPKAAGGKR